MGIATTALLGMGLSAIGGMKQAEGAEAAGKAQAESQSYQAAIARNNALMATRNAQMSTEAGDVLATQEGMKTAAEVSGMKAKQAASGIDVNTGSAVSARDAAIRIGEINALTIKSNKAREAWGYNVDARNQGEQAALDTKSSAYAKKAGEMGYDSTLLSTAGSVVGQWQKYQTTATGIDNYPSIGNGGMY